MANTAAKSRASLAPRRETWFSLDAWRAFHDRHAVVIWSFLASRLMLLAVGLLTLVNIRPLTNAGNPLSQSAHQALNIWGASDSGWYLDLATNGYQLVPAANGQANWAFFPAMPGLAAGLARLTSLTPFEAMLVVSNLSFLIALVLLHRLARQAFDAKTADVTVVLLCVAPAMLEQQGKKIHGVLASDAPPKPEPNTVNRATSGTCACASGSTGTGGASRPLKERMLSTSDDSHSGTRA